MVQVHVFAQESTCIRVTAYQRTLVGHLMEIIHARIIISFSFLTGSELAISWLMPSSFSLFSGGDHLQLLPEVSRLHVANLPRIPTVLLNFLCHKCFKSFFHLPPISPAHPFLSLPPPPLPSSLSLSQPELQVLTVQETSGISSAWSEPLTADGILQHSLPVLVVLQFN